MRILIEQSDYSHLNYGERVILRAAYSRLKDLFPHASFAVLTRNAEALVIDCPLALPVMVGAPLESAQPRAHPLLLAGKKWLRRQRQTTLSAQVNDAMNEADLVVATGGAYLNASFGDHAYKTYEFLSQVAKSGIPFALMGHSFEPFTDDAIKQYAEQILPQAALITCRDSEVSPAILEALDIDERKYYITGDEAVEIVYNVSPAELGSGIGVHLRVDAHAEIGGAEIAWLRPLLHQAIEQFDSDLVPLPFAIDKDPAPIQTVTGGDGGASVDSVEKLLAQFTKCRVVVTSNYHAAVFALAMGISVVGVVNSPTYADKFKGLKSKFHGGVTVIQAHQEGASEAIYAAWDEAPKLRTELLHTTRKQITAIKGAYTLLRALIRG